MKVCEVIRNVPESRLQDVKDAITMGGCTPRETKRPDGNYDVESVCEKDTEIEK